MLVGREADRVCLSSERKELKRLEAEY
jgi:hypothetical protein